MLLTSINLKNFRSHKDTQLNFSDRLNYIVGGNGQGKTSILETIFYLCTTKNYNNRSDSEAVTFNESGFEIKGTFKDGFENRIRIHYSASENRKYYFKEDKRIYKAADVIGKFPVVVLTPEDHAITQGSPADRRKFVDSVISQASETYLLNLIDYNKILKQRSSLLTQIKETGRKNLFDELESWSSILVRTGAYIINQRKFFMEEFKQYVNESYKQIMENEETPEIKYSSLENYIGEDIDAEFSRLLKLKKDEEIARGINLVGPQRDEFIFSIDGRNLKTYGSQGQHKTFQAVLRFAEFFYLKERTGTSPIFLLDDVFGELDIRRSAKISRYLNGVGQAFITITDFSNLSFLTKTENDKIIRLKEGSVVYA